MNKLRLLDLFCGGGGAAMGYHRAGFEVVGVDNQPQPKYPFKFVQADALMYAVAFGRQFDVIHASPPCQAYSSITPDKAKHKAMIAITRRVLQWIGKPYIIENVEHARHELVNPIRLCGTMFGLLLVRHRYFETIPPVYFAPAPCNHTRKVVKHGRKPDRDKNYAALTGHFSDVEFGQIASGIDWLGQKGLAQAIPPAYTEWLGNEMIKVIS
jgi:DNA (cytosine-5)-methyltransferase 1